MAAGFSKPLKTSPIGQSQQQAIDSNISNKTKKEKRNEKNTLHPSGPLRMSVPDSL